MQVKCVRESILLTTSRGRTCFALFVQGSVLIKEKRHAGFFMLLVNALDIQGTQPYMNTLIKKEKWIQKIFDIKFSSRSVSGVQLD